MLEALEGSPDNEGFGIDGTCPFEEQVLCDVGDVSVADGFREDCELFELVKDGVSFSDAWHCVAPCGVRVRTNLRVRA